MVLRQPLRTAHLVYMKKILYSKLSKLAICGKCQLNKIDEEKVFIICILDKIDECNSSKTLNLLFQENGMYSLELHVGCKCLQY
jgi:hypothetical protein